PASGPAEPRLQPMPRLQLGTAPGRQRRAAGASDRIPALSSGVAEPRLAPRTDARLSHRDPRGTLRVRRRRAGRPGAVLDVAGARDAVRSAGCAALKADHGRLSAISSAGRPRPPIGTTIYCFSPAK